MNPTGEKDANLRVFRPAGLLERFHISRHLHGCNACVVVGAKLESPADATLQKDEFLGAVAHAVSVHPSLSLCVQDPQESQGVPTLCCLPRIDLEKAVYFSGEGVDASTAAMTLETAITEQFKSDNLEAPLWRFTVTSSNYVIFVYHHLLGDGQSGLAVLRTVVEALNSPSDLSESTTVVTPSASLELIPNIENRIKVSPSFGVVFRAVLDQLLPGWLTRDIWTGNNVVERLPPPPNWIGTRLRLIALPPAAASELVARARSHKTTVTSILHYIGVLALSHLITHPRHAATISSDGKEATKSPYKRLNVGIPVSLRSQAGIPPTQMYEAASSITQIETLIPTHSLSFPCCAGECESTSNWVETFPWRAAAKLSQTLKSSGPRARSELGLLKFVDGKFEEFWQGKLGKKRSATLEVSNVGVWSFGSHGRNADAGKDAGTEATFLPTDTRWGVTSAYFAQDDNVVGSALKLNAIGSPSGELNVCVTWGEGSVDEEFAETFATLVGHVLSELSKA